VRSLDSPRAAPAARFAAVGCTVLWFRRDLRLTDHPALLAAAAGGDEVLPLFVVDPRLWDPAGPPRRAWLVRSLRALDAAVGGRLVVRQGDPAVVVPRLAAQVDAAAVHVTADAGPYGRRRDDAVAAALAARPLVRTGTPYAVGPGTITNGSGTPYRVFTPFFKAWQRHGWPRPAPRGEIRWATGPDSDGLPAEPALDGVTLPEAGEAAALARWHAFLDADPGVAGYAARRNDPSVAGTSAMSAHLKYGEIHPRTMLADLADHPGPGADGLRSELCWREFYADVLWHTPSGARSELRTEFAGIRVDQPTADPQAQLRWAAWQQGRTGYPLVDAGMRQLRAEGWMHNRVRMVVASFLVKDLHLPWQLGAADFMHWLRDGDLASNSQGWQWTAGCGTDAAPYYRVFNPVTQGLRFDPDGAYVRRYVPELAHLRGAAAHEPWDADNGYAHGYPERVVDHGVERDQALARLAELRQP